MKAWLYSLMLAGALAVSLAAPADAERRPKCQVVCIQEMANYDMQHSDALKGDFGSEWQGWQDSGPFCRAADPRDPKTSAVHQVCVDCMKRCQGHYP